MSNAAQPKHTPKYVTDVAYPYCGAGPGQRCYRILAPFKYVPYHGARHRAYRYAKLTGAE